MVTLKKNLLIGVSLFPILTWLAVISYYAVDLPWYDDFDPFPDFLWLWIHSASFSERLGYLFQPNNEHRMVIGKLVTLLYYGLTGKLNFIYLNFAGAAFTLGTVFLFWRSFLSNKFSWFYFIPVLFLLFQLQDHLVYLWAICSLQHQPVVFFLCLSMFCLSKGNISLAILAAFCANFAMSNGVFVWVAGFVVLLLSSDYKHLVLWVTAAGISIFLYFNGLSTLGNEASIQYFQKFPHLSILGFFAFLGGLFDLLPNRRIEIRTALPILMGFLLMLWVVKWLWYWLVNWWNFNFNRSYFVQNLKMLEPNTKLLLGIMTFLLVNALIIGLLRPRFGFFVMVVSNYKMYPALFLATTYLGFISFQKSIMWQLVVFKIGLFASLFIWLFSFYSYLPEVAERNKYLTVNGWNQHHNGFGLGHVPFSDGAKYVDNLMKELISQNVYHYPAVTDVVAKAVKGIEEPMSVESGVTVQVIHQEIIIQEMQGEPFYSKSYGRYAFLKAGEKVYLYKMTQHNYSGRNIFRLFDKGSTVQIPYATVPKGNYQVGYIEMLGDQHKGGILKTIVIP